MQAEWVIRDVRHADESALVALELASPEGGDVAVQIGLRLGYLELVARYPGVRGYVATDLASQRVIGMLFSSVAPTQLAGHLVPGAYLFSLRIHPAFRRQGVASGLIAHALSAARDEADIEVAWAVVMAGNEASLRTFARAGFRRLRDLAIQISLPSIRPAPLDSAWTLRSATLADLPALAEALNCVHAEHDLWRPCTAQRLEAELTAAAHHVEDVALVTDRQGGILAAGAPFDPRRTARLRVLGHRRLPPALNRAFSPLLSRLPLRPLVLRHRVLSAARAAAGLALLGALRHPAGWPPRVLATPLDPRDPAWPLVSRTATFSRRLHLLATGSPEPGLSRALAVT